MAKRLVAILLAAALILCTFCSCKDKKPNNKDDTSSKQLTVTDTDSAKDKKSGKKNKKNKDDDEIIVEEYYEDETDSSTSDKSSNQLDYPSDADNNNFSKPSGSSDKKQEIEYIYEYEDDDNTETKSVSALCSKTFKTLPAEHTSLLASNPDRGWRSEEQIWVPNDINILKKTSYTEILSEVKSDVQTNTLLETISVTRLYFIMNYYKDTYELPKETIEYMEKYLKAYKEIGVKVYLNTYYQHGLEATDFGAPKEIILHHLDSYGKLWKKYKDVIYAINFGLMGSYGEWTAIKPALSNSDKQEIVDKVISLVPEDTYLIMRQPKYKNEFIRKSNKRYNTIGYAEDAFFGKMFPNDDYGQGQWRPGSDDWAQSVKESPYTICDGELFTTRWFKENGIYVEPYSSIQAMSELHLTTFNVNHGYGDYAMYKSQVSQTVLYGWKCEEITSARLKKLGVLVTPTWFKKADGTTVKRNVFEYVRDYVGYNLSAQKLKVTGSDKKGEKINVSMSLKNYGFSAAFNLKSGFVILDKNNNIVSKVYAGDPTKWYSTNPANYKDRTQLTHKVSAKMTLPKKKGTYKIAFFMENTLGQTARLNNTIEYSDGYNILHMFTIE